MIVVDASALIAILDKEPDAALYAEAIAEADPPIISAATLLEVNIEGWEHRRLISLLGPFDASRMTETWKFT